MNNRIYIFLCLIALFLYQYIIKHHSPFILDVDCWVRWAWFGIENGFDKMYFYVNENNYLPLYQYVLFGYASIFRDFQDYVNHVYGLKYFSFLFDVAGIFLVYKWLDKRYSFWFLFFLALLNVSFFYNSLIWGQVDAILGLFVFASLYFLWNQKLIPSAISLGLALCFKLQAIVFIPLYGLLFLVIYEKQYWIKNIGIAIGCFSLSFFLPFLPFIKDAEHIAMLKKAIGSLVGYFPNITYGASNFWSMFFGGEADAISDQIKWLNLISYNKIGFILFCLSSFIAFVPMMKFIWNKRIKSNAIQSTFPLDQLLLTASLIGLNFYFFNTQIHERYSHPVFLFLMTYSFMKMDFIPFILFSILYFLCLDRIHKWTHFPSYDIIIFNRHLLGLGHFVLLGYLNLKLFKIQIPFVQNWTSSTVK